MLVYSSVRNKKWDFLVIYTVIHIVSGLSNIFK